MSNSTDSPRSRLDYLRTPVDGDLLTYFRIVFGFFGLLWTLKQFGSGAIETHYILPRYHFHYFGFEWVRAWSPEVTRFAFYALGVASGLIAIGVCYRIATITFAAIFTHLFLVDKCLYQNHYYLICVVAWILCVLPCPARTAGARSRTNVPRWTLWLLRYQLALPYVFGSVAKWNADWIGGEPIRSMLLQRADLPVLGPWLTLPGAVGVFVWGGLLFDLLVVPGLLSRRFRKVACGFAVFFHLTNACLFTIGIFPWFMLATLPIFFPPGSLRAFLQQSGLRWGSAALSEPAGTAAQFDPAASTYLASKIALEANSNNDDALELHAPTWRTYLAAVLLAAIVLAQALIPLRHYALPGNVHWTEEGHCFSWHMLVRGKRCALRLMATDPATNRTGSIDLRNYVSAFQLPRVAREPRLIRQLVEYVEHDLRVQGFDAIELRALCLVSLNGRKPQHLIDPTVDLTQTLVGWDVPEWIVPLHESLREDPWNAPMSTWEEALATP